MRPTDVLTRRQLLAATAGALAIAPWLVACGGDERSEPQAQPAQPPAPASEQAPRPATPPGAQPAPAPAPGSPAAGDPAAAGAGDAPLVTEVPAMQPLVQSLQYVNQSPKPDQRCENCVLFVADAFPGEKGRCQLFAQGAVVAPGWCASWQPKPPGA